MEHKDNKIEQMLQNSFEDYSLPEFKNSWGAIRKTFLKKKLLQFSLKTVNIYTGIILSAIMVIPTILFVSSQDTNFNDPQIQLIVSDTVYVIDNFTEIHEDTNSVLLQDFSTVSSIKDFSENASSENNTINTTNTKRKNVEQETQNVNFDSMQVVETVDSSKNDVSNTDTSSNILQSTKKKVIVVQKPPIILYDTVVKKVSQ